MFPSINIRVMPDSVYENLVCHLIQHQQRSDNGQYYYVQKDR